jgi:hypothetical protein
LSQPVITQVDVIYNQNRGYKLPGEPARIRITAFDADTHTVEVTVCVRDSAGAEQTQGVMVLQSDPLTFEATMVTAGHTVTQDPAISHEFVVV